MAQAFVTTYRNHYRWHSEPVRKLKRPVDKHAIKPPEGDYWIDLAQLQKMKKEFNIAYAQALVNQSFRRMNFSTYQINYCRDKVMEKCRELHEAVKAQGGTEGGEAIYQSFENELLKYCEDLYRTVKTEKILPPGETKRRIHGYVRPESMYTPLTNYQLLHGKAGYDILRSPMKFLDIHKQRKADKNFPQCEHIELPLKETVKKCEEFPRIGRKAMEMKRNSRTTEENLKTITVD